MDVKQLQLFMKYPIDTFQKCIEEFGIINQNKGIEFVSHELTTKPITLKNAGISFLPARKEQKSSRLCAFHDLTDYLAYLSLQDNGFIRLPSDCDVIIMSDVRNFLHLLIEGDDYNRVYLFFPNDVTGNTITQTLIDRYGRYAVPCNTLYKGIQTCYSLQRQLKFHQMIVNRSVFYIYP